MKGDFSRNTFDPQKHFSRVLMQQGRVQLDADWNEQVSIILHYLQTLAKDLIGPFAGPDGNDYGFEIQQNQDESDNFIIGAGRYYVDGFLCENEKIQNAQNKEVPITYFTQKDYPLDKGKIIQRAGKFLVYLDVWERHLTYIEADDDNKPSIREVALSGPDTATRAKIVWQVKITHKINDQIPVPDKPLGDLSWKDWISAHWIEFVEFAQSKNIGLLRVKGKEDSKESMEPCIISPEARYRGAENQLYRVEIHTPGNKDKATFKWSRENGSVIFPIREPIQGNTIKLEHLGRDSSFGLAIGDWMEIVDDDYILQGRAEPLLQVDKIDPINITVTLNGKIANIGKDPSKHPLLRRWDQKEGTVEIKESKTEWLTLEDGIQIQFQQQPAHKYRTGDYWLIPARTATGDVEWPKDETGPVARAPHGVEHHYAPLAIIKIEGNNTVNIIDDLRRTINGH